MFININKNKFNNPTKSNNFEAFLKFIDELILKKSVTEVKKEDVIILNRNDFENDETFEKAKKLLDKNKFTPSEIFKTSKINSYKNIYF
jgi:hypothetical protein